MIEIDGLVPYYDELYNYGFGYAGSNNKEYLRGLKQYFMNDSSIIITISEKDENLFEEEGFNENVENRDLVVHIEFSFRIMFFEYAYRPNPGGFIVNNLHKSNFPNANQLKKELDSLLKIEDGAMFVNSIPYTKDFTLGFA